ncbi:MAG: hypothetical protein ABL921_18320 [Pirellula sp.]
MDAFPKTIYSAPRILDLASLLIITACYAFMFAVMKWMMLSVNAMIFFSGLITCAAIAQAVMFGAKAPRKASMLVGLVFGVWVCLQLDRAYLRKFDLGYVVLIVIPRFVQESKIALTILGVFFGLVIGYIAGTCVGGVFLVSDRLRQFLSRDSRVEG